MVALFCWFGLLICLIFIFWHLVRPLGDGWNAGFWCILTVNEPFYHSLSYFWLWIFLFLSLARLVSLVFPAVFSALFPCSPVSVSYAASGWLSKCFQARAICTDLVGSLALLWEKEEKKNWDIQCRGRGSIDFQWTLLLQRKSIKECSIPIGFTNLAASKSK